MTSQMEIKALEIENNTASFKKILKGKKLDMALKAARLSHEKALKKFEELDGRRESMLAAYNKVTRELYDLHVLIGQLNMKINRLVRGEPVEEELDACN